MVTVYKTKRDINGNTYYLTLDHSAKTYSDFSALCIADAKPITVGKRELSALRADAIAAGYRCKT